MNYYKKWLSLSTNNQNKPNMALLFKFKFLIAFLMGVNFINKYQNLVILKSGNDERRIGQEKNIRAVTFQLIVIIKNYS